MLDLQVLSAVRTSNARLLGLSLVIPVGCEVSAAGRGWGTAVLPDVSYLASGRPGSHPCQPV